MQKFTEVGMKDTSPDSKEAHRAWTPWSLLEKRLKDSVQRRHRQTFQENGHKKLLKAASFSFKFRYEF